MVAGFMKKSGFIGIDLGASGGIAYTTHDKSEYGAVKMFDERQANYQTIRYYLQRLSLSCSEIYIGLEEVNGRAAQGASNSFSWGVNCGQIYTHLDMLDTIFNEIKPTVWQKALGLNNQSKGMSKTQRKSFYKEQAIRLYPDQKITLHTADAFLIAEYMLQVRETVRLHKNQPQWR